MKMKHYEVTSVFALIIVLGSAAFGASIEKSAVSAASAVASIAPSQSPAQAGQEKPADAPLTRDEILKQGPAALEQNCTKCHQSDKWEGSNRNHDGWSAIVMEMSRQMADAQMPPMSNKTTNLIVDYLTLTRPQ